MTKKKAAKKPAEKQPAPPPADGRPQLDRTREFSTRSGIIVGDWRYDWPHLMQDGKIYREDGTLLQPGDADHWHRAPRTKLPDRMPPLSEVT